MQDNLLLFSRFPYSHPNYDNIFISKQVINCIQEFCKEFNIQAFYAKGSIAYGLLTKGSDIDHVRFQVKKDLPINIKKDLVDTLEQRLQLLGIKKLKRIREDDYVRVFYMWTELVLVPNADNIHEIYPNLKIITATDKLHWLRRVITIGYSYTGKISFKWILKVIKRIYEL